jgi:hypothetical protein
MKFGFLKHVFKWIFRHFLVFDNILFQVNFFTRKKERKKEKYDKLMILLVELLSELHNLGFLLFYLLPLIDLSRRNQAVKLANKQNN